MKRRILWLALGLLLGMAAGYFYLRPVRPPPPAPAAKPVPPAAVAIQDGKTIDFSGGKAEVRDTTDDRAALERAKREMEAAAKDVKFAPAKPAPKPD
jgi:hypothetical protein